jgi:uncharacterized protein YndB with AHSA1/START domain
MSGEDEAGLGRISPEAVREATGRAWREWLEELDAVGAADWDHKEIVAHLAREHPEAVSSWWRQSIAVGYERARGKRAVGQTADGGFQVGVRRSVAASPAAAWRLVTSRPDLWLGEGASVAFEEGARYEVPPAAGAPGASGVVRVVRPGERLRMTWRPEAWTAPATLQLTFTESRPGTTAITVHLERLPDADAREVLRQRFRAALERVAEAVA